MGIVAETGQSDAQFRVIAEHTLSRRDLGENPRIRLPPVVSAKCSVGRLPVGGERFDMNVLESVRTSLPRDIFSSFVEPRRPMNSMHPPKVDHRVFRERPRGFTAYRLKRNIWQQCSLVLSAQS